MSEGVHHNTETTGKQVCLSTGIEFSVSSGSTAARSALEQIISALQPLKLDIEETSTVEIVLAEVVNNIVEHSYGDLEGPITIRFSHHHDGLHVAITDQGCVMPDGRTPIGQLQPRDVDVDDLPEGGFGWFLIQDLAKDVLYQRVGNENQLHLRIAVAYGHSH